MSYKKHSCVMITVIISISCFIGISIYAAPTIQKIGMSPANTEILAGSEAVALTVKASGSKLTYEWMLQGQGTLQEPTTKPAVFYIPPPKLDVESVQVMISILVKDEQGEEATESILLKIIRNSDQITKMPEPEPAKISSIATATSNIAEDERPRWIDSRAVYYTEENACQEPGREKKWSEVRWGKVRVAGSKSPDAGYIYYTICQGKQVIAAWVLEPGNENPEKPDEKYRCIRHYADDKNYCFELR